MKTILMATDEPFWRQNRGGFVRIASLYRFLTGNGFQLPIFFLKNLSEKEVLEVGEALGERRIFPPARESPVVRLRNKIKFRLRWYLSRIYHRAMGRPAPHYPEPTIGDYFSRVQQSRFRHLCARIQPDFVLVEYIRFAYLVDGLRPFLPDHAQTLIDTHDVMHLRCQRFKEYGERHWINITEEEERQALDLFDVILAIQPGEAQVFRRMLPEKPVITVGHASPIVKHPARQASPVTFVYVGTHGPHNQRAIRWFLTEIWPDLWRRFGKQIRMDLVGSVCGTLRRDEVPQGVDLRGIVDDLDAVYQGADIIVNPVFFGGGLKIKNVEALCHGRPLITSAIGAEGLGHANGNAYFVCDDAAMTLETCARLIDNPDLRQQTSQAALAFAHRHFSEDRTYRELMTILMEG